MQSRKLKILLGLFFLAIVAGGALGAWSLLASTRLTGKVTSLAPETVIYFEQSVTQFGVIDTTNSTKSWNSTVILQNENGDTWFNISIDEDRELLNPICGDYESDVVIGYKIDNTPYNHGDDLLVTTGEHNLTVLYNATKRSCPQNLNVTVVLSELFP